MNNVSVKYDSAHLTAKSKKELALEYKVSGKTLRSWLLKKGFDPGTIKLFNPMEVRWIYDNLGYPFDDE